ncbi:MAG: BCCT family transporter, partial [Pseudomonadota bacterium]
MAETAESDGDGSRALLIASLGTIAGIGIWGVVDPDSLLAAADRAVGDFFRSRGWFVMLAATGMLALCIGLAASPLGRLRLGADDDRPEFSTPSWIAMLFAAGMGVGLLFWATAEPLTHFAFVKEMVPDPIAAEQALLATNFHWGVHAWAIYGS